MLFSQLSILTRVKIFKVLSLFCQMVKITDKCSWQEGEISTTRLTSVLHLSGKRTVKPPVLIGQLCR